MDHQIYVYGTAMLIVGTLLAEVLRRRFDPFAPLWLFLAGYAQVYIVQAISYHDENLRVRGPELLARANWRALWALAWFLLVYFAPLGTRAAKFLPRAPFVWSPGLVLALAPFLFGWGLYCSMLGIVTVSHEVTAEEQLLYQFPIFLLMIGVLFIVTGRSGERPRPLLTLLGIGTGLLYSTLWMYNGKRSHALFGVLATVAAAYVARGKRPSWPVLLATALAGMMAVSLAIGWRGNMRYERTFSGFLQYVGEFPVASVLTNLNMSKNEDVPTDRPEFASKETEEMGGFLLMMDAVPEKSGYDYGLPYLRLITTYIPRVIWPDKPLYGREKWVAAWIAGSEFPRDETFTGPAIGILGATQLNGGAIATAIVMALLALLLRTAYEYFRLYAMTPWAQAWWSLTFFNSWLMTVNDDPFVWFYYVYGHMTLPPLAALWIYHRMAESSAPPA